MYLNLIFALILFTIVACLFRDGLWSNTLGLFNAVTAALIATNYFEPLTRMLSDLVPFMDYNWDVVTLGVLFALSYAALRKLTLLVSPYRVRFHPLLDQIGGGIMAAWIGWVGVCFICFALHTSPLSRTFLFDNFQPEQSMFFGTAPDRQWLAFAHKVSNGGGWGRNVTNEQGEVVSAFDPRAEYMLKYASRRKWLESQESAFASGS